MVVVADLLSPATIGFKVVAIIMAKLFVFTTIIDVEAIVLFDLSNAAIIQDVAMNQDATDQDASFIVNVDLD